MIKYVVVICALEKYRSAWFLKTSKGVNETLPSGNTGILKTLVKELFLSNTFV